MLTDKPNRDIVPFRQGSRYGLLPIFMWMALGVSSLFPMTRAEAVSPSAWSAYHSIAAGWPTLPHSGCLDCVICISSPLNATTPTAGPFFGGWYTPITFAWRFHPAFVSASPINSIKAMASGSKFTEKSKGVPANCFNCSTSRCWAADLMIEARPRCFRAKHRPLKE